MHIEGTYVKFYCNLQKWSKILPPQIDFWFDGFLRISDHHILKTWSWERCCYKILIFPLAVHNFEYTEIFKILTKFQVEIWGNIGSIYSKNEHNGRNIVSLMTVTLVDMNYGLTCNERSKYWLRKDSDLTLYFVGVWLRTYQISRAWSTLLFFLKK